MSRLIIEREPFSQTKFYAGTCYSDPTLWEDEYQEDAFDFVVEVQENLEENTQQIVGITWTDKIPSTAQEAEDKINQTFFALIND